MRPQSAGPRTDAPKLSLSVARTGSVGNVRGDEIVIDNTPPIMTGMYVSPLKVKAFLGSQSYRFDNQLFAIWIIDQYSVLISTPILIVTHSYWLYATTSISK